MDSGRVPTTHQFPWALCGIPCPQMFLYRYETHIHPNADRQHHCRRLHLSDGGSKSEYNNLAVSIWDWCISRNFWLSAVHIAGNLNAGADGKSIPAVLTLMLSQYRGLITASMSFPPLVFYQGSYKNPTRQSNGSTDCPTLADPNLVSPSAAFNGSTMGNPTS